MSFLIFFRKVVYNIVHGGIFFMDGLVDTFSNRLNMAMKIRNIKATELSLKTGIAKSSLSEYINGKYEAKQDGLYLLAKALNVSESWLIGRDVPMERDINQLLNNISDVPTQCCTSFNTEGLDEDDIEEINHFIEFIKNNK